MAKSSQACPCGYGPHYEQCCQPLHLGQPAPSAEALMRARYSAYVLDQRDYLVASWHPDTRPAELEPNSHAASRWLGLKIVQQRALPNGDWQVEFVARYRQTSGKAVRLHEISRFCQVDGQWRYLDGHAPT